jgi:exopolyphosphatase/guanosine-5'-triphosphate,3'-diphosphate pyrophosphatase
MGCVSMSRRFFADGRISREAMDRAVLAGRVEMQPVSRMFDADRWQTAVGSSGTIRAIERVVIANDWSDDGITKSSLKRLRRALVSAGHVDKLRLDGLSDDRRPVFAGGVAVLSAVFKALDIKRMQVSDLALREGLLYELVGHIRHIDIRDSTVRALMQRFGVDKKQARRVEGTANTLLQQLSSDWDLGAPEHGQMLGWACRLHEIGLTVSHNSFHKHGAYILANADMPGFSRPQQALLGALVRAHRRKFVDQEFALLPSRVREYARRLTVLLRLAALVHRGRSGSHRPPLTICAEGSRIQIEFADRWLSKHPLTGAEIAREAEYLASAGFTLQYA